SASRKIAHLLMPRWVTCSGMPGSSRRGSRGMVVVAGELAVTLRWMTRPDLSAERPGPGGHGLNWPRPLFLFSVSLHFPRPGLEWAQPETMGQRMTTTAEISWPALPYGAWKDTYATLHMWLQVVGKVAL